MYNNIRSVELLEMICNEIKDIQEEMKKSDARYTKICEMINETCMTETKANNKQIENIEKLNEYDKIILRNLESRISILEEETNKYERD